MKQLIATGSSYGALPHVEHAANAVRNAMTKMQSNQVGAVLLFLTNGYAAHPDSAIKEAVKTAGTVQVSGCCAIGLLTEEEWLLDVEGAVAMVFPNDLAPLPLAIQQQRNITPPSVLTITTPNTDKQAVNATTLPQFGAVCSDEYGHGPFALWQNGRAVKQGYYHLAFPENYSIQSTVAESIRQLSSINEVNQSQQHQLIEIDGQSAYQHLVNSLPRNLEGIDLRQPYNLLCAISETPDVESIKKGYFKLHHIISIDEEKQIVHLSGTVKKNHHVFWAIRDANKSFENMTDSVNQSLSSQAAIPDFALMFINQGRGPEFYHGVDKDLQIFKESYPNTPLLGFYGNGEIAPGSQLAGLIHRYATVLSLFHNNDA